MEQTNAETQTDTRTDGAPRLAGGLGLSHSVRRNVKVQCVWCARLYAGVPCGKDGAMRPHAHKLRGGGRCPGSNLESDNWV